MFSISKLILITLLNINCSYSCPTQVIITPNDKQMYILLKNKVNLDKTVTYYNSTDTIKVKMSCPCY